MVRAVEREVAIEARPEAVWEFLVDSELAKRWMGVTASLDTRPGGDYRVEVVPGKVAVGEFVELDPPRRLVWTWGWADNDPITAASTTIEVVLEPTDDGTLLRFSQVGLPDEASVVAHEKGWDKYLGRLAAVARGDDPGPDPALRRAA